MGPTQLFKQENMIVTREAAEVENMQPPPAQAPMPAPVPAPGLPAKIRSASRTATKSHRPSDVVTVDPQPETSPDGPETAFSSANRVRIYFLMKLSFFQLLYDDITF